MQFPVVCLFLSHLLFNGVVGMTTEENVSLQNVGSPLPVSTTSSSTNAPVTRTKERDMTNPPDGPNGLTDMPPERTPLYVSFFVSLGAVDSSSSYVAADLALGHVNEREDVLPGYKLVLTLSDSACDDGKAIKAFFDEIFRDPQELMVIGPSCSTAAQAIASTAKFWNLNVMSPTASSPALLNRNKYPTFTRIIPSDTSLNPSRIKLMKTFNWTRVATIHENHELFSLSIDDLLTRLKDNNITVISSESFDEDPTNQVENLKKQDAKIIVGNMYYPAARKVFCEAYKHGMYGEGYVWMMLGEYISEWYKEKDDTLSCTMEELLEAVESSMYIGNQAPVLGKENTVTIAGITPPEYLRMLDEHLLTFEEYTLTDQASYGYDAVWSVALALNETMNILKATPLEDGSFKKLEDFTFDDKELSKIMLQELNAVQFEGVSGPISFFEGERIGLIDMEQLRGSCQDGWSINGRWCYQFITDPDTWEGAVLQCENKKAYLMDIITQSENEALIKMRAEQNVEGISQWFISLKLGPDGYQWTGGSFGSTDWVHWDESMIDIEEEDGSCFVTDISQDKWKTVQCTSKHAFVCKKVAEFQQVLFARHDIARDSVEWLSNVVWPGGQVPLDHTPQIVFTLVEIYQGIPLVMYIAMCSVAAVGIVLALVFLTFNIWFRQQKFMKMSSPNLNNLIVIGSILIYGSTCLSGWDSEDISNKTYLSLCQTRTWIFSVGFVLSFGSMFSKTWRVHKVAALKNPKRVIITDRHLFVMVAVLLLLDILLLTAWFIMNPMRVQREYLYRMEDRELQLILQPYIQYCTSDNIIYWQGALYGYKALLLIFGTFLAWETRKVTIPALNDSKLIGLCVYNVVLLSAIGVGVNLALDTDPAGSFIFTSAIQTFCTSVTLIVIFVPKILSVYKYPEGKPVTTMKTNSTNLASVDGNMGKDEEIERLKEIIDKEKKILLAPDEIPTGLNEYQQLQSKASDKNVKKQSGCGFWVGAVSCGCCSSDMSDVDEASPGVKM